MHLIFENIIRNLLAFWRGEFKGLDYTEKGPYVINEPMWEMIGGEIEKMNKLTPSIFGRRARNIWNDRASLTAEDLANFILIQGPYVLRGPGRLPPNYYKHFLDLRKIVISCISYRLDPEGRADVREHVERWEADYEQLYYQYKYQRLSACPSVLHRFLHIPDFHDWIGPSWATWAFAGERLLGILKTHLGSRIHPYENLMNHIVQMEQLRQIKIKYHLTFDSDNDRSLTQGQRIPNYACSLLRPSRGLTLSDLSEHERRILINHLFTISDQEFTKMEIRKELEEEGMGLREWGKVKLDHNGDTVVAEGGGSIQSDFRERQITTYADLNAEKPDAPIVYAPHVTYGRLDRIIQLHFRANPHLFAFVREVETTVTDDGLIHMPFGLQLRERGVVDLKCIGGLVGRATTYDESDWWIVERAEEVVAPEFVEEELILT
ncbi:hypothetical protein BT69DRAFT_1217563 [Atractiella rhizophila]|nr:hypothetical protein BT69DRAFT_1217563 [Atractiella rhizophila]